MVQVLTQVMLMFMVASGALVSQLLIKHGINSGGPLTIANFEDLIGFFLRVLTTPVLLFGYGLSGVTGLLWIIVLGRTDLSYAVPMMSATYFVLVLVTSGLVLGENVSVWRWAGTLVILVGALLVARGG